MEELDEIYYHKFLLNANNLIFFKYYELNQFNELCFKKLKSINNKENKNKIKEKKI